MPNIIPPTYQERILFLGSNGSGKSVLAREMLDAGYARWIVLDVKGDFKPKGKYLLIRHLNSWKWSLNAPKILYQPEMEFVNSYDLSEFLRRMYTRAKKYGKRYPFILYIDEGLFISKTGATKWLSNLAVAGRSMGVGLWVASQRPKWIPVEVRSEAWRLYIFYLSYKEDEREISKYTKGRLTENDLEKGTQNYSFWEIKRGKESAGRLQITHFPPIRFEE